MKTGYGPTVDAWLDSLVEQGLLDQEFETDALILCLAIVDQVGAPAKVLNTIADLLGIERITQP